MRSTILGGARAPLFALLLALAAFLAAPMVRSDADAADRKGKVLVDGAQPFRDSWQGMRRRDAQFLAAVRQGRVKAPPRVVAITPPFGEEGEQEVPPAKNEAQTFFAAPRGEMPQTTGVTFEGISMQNEFSSFGSGNYPPDTNGAVGPNHFLEAINGGVGTYSKTGTSLGLVSLNSFMAVPSTSYPRNGAFDPRVLFDVRSGHWFVAALEFGNNQNDNDLILAVSATSDPTGSWNKYVLPVGVAQSGATTYFTDFPTLGVDDNGVYAAVRIFGSDNSSSAEIVATPKASLIAPSPSLGTVTAFSNITDMYSTPMPAYNQDPSASGAPEWIFASAPFLQNLVYRTVTWSGGTPTLSATTTISTAPFGFPSAAPASGSTTNIDTGDIRLQMAIVRNSHLWCVRTVAVNSSGGSSSTDRTGCEWFDVNVSSTPAVNQTGRVYDNSATDPRFYYYPSIAVSGQGHAIMGFAGSKGAEFAASYMTGRLSSDSSGVMGSVVQLHAGQAAYTRNDPSSRNRWGDYSYCSLDPNDDMTLWTIQEYSSSVAANIWATSVAQLKAPAPTLNSPSATVMGGTTGATLNLTGTGFYDPGANYPSRVQVQISGGATNGISGISAVYNSPTSLSVSYNIAANASAGARNITVTNPDGQSATVNGGLTVQSANTNTVQFSSATYSVAENGGSATITVSRTGTTTGTASVQYATTDGTATAGSDYTTASGTLNFGAGDTSKSFPVPITSDQALEGSQTVNLTLSSPGGTGVGLGATTTAVLTIMDDTASPAPTGLSATPNSTSSIQLSWTNHCTNQDGFQIDRKVGAGSFAQITSVTGTQFTDTGLSAGVLYTYRVRATKGMLTSDNSATAAATITTVQFSTDTYSVGEGAAATITVTRSGDTSGSASISYATSDGTATAGQDYTTAMGTLNFGAGDSSKTFMVTALADHLLESTETVSLTLSSPSNLVLGSTTSATLSIMDDPTATAPTGLSIDTSANTMQLSWTNHCDNADAVQVERKIKPSGNYLLIKTLGPSVTSVVDDTAVSGTSYSYRVRAKKASLGSAYSNEVTATVNIPLTLQFSAATYSVSEGGTASVTVTLSVPSPGGVTVAYTATGGTATAGTDFTAVSGTLNFGAGQSSQMFPVPTAADRLLEGDETVNLTLSSPAGASVGTQSTAVLTIQDDLSAPAPSGTSAYPVSSGTVGLTWTDNCDNETGFHVERKDSLHDYAEIGTPGPNTSVFLDTTATAGIAYTYRVRAANGSIFSTYSPEVTVTILTGGKAALSSKKLSFGTLKAGATKTLTLKLTNKGRGALSGVVGTLSAPFSLVSGSGPFTLQPKQSLTLRVTYAPTAAGTAGGTLTITTTDPVNSSLAVALTGKRK